MSRTDPEELLVEDLSPAEREALRARAEHDPAVATALRLATALASADAETWRAAETPALRFAPEGAGERRSWWGRLVGGGTGLGSPLVAAAAGVALLAGLAGGFALRGGGDGDGPAVDARLEAAPGVSLVRTGSAPPEAGGVARMLPGRDGRMMLRVHGLRPTGDDRVYAVWMRGATGKAVRVGTFRVREDGTGGSHMPLAVDPKRYPSMEIRLQPPSAEDVDAGEDVLKSSPA